MGNAEDAYLFRHAMMRLAAYELQPPVERAVLHRHAYAIIEKLPHEDPDAFAYELAGHARDAAVGEADQRRRAEMARREAEWLSRAMQRARSNSSFRIALECAERTLTNDEATVEQRHAAALQAAEMSASLGEFARVPEYLERAERIQAGQQPSLRAAWILTRVNAISLPRREYEPAIRALREALGIYQQTGDRLGEARATGYLGNVLARTGERDEAIRQYERSEAIFRELGHRRGLSTCRGNLGLMYRYFGQHDKAEAAYREALQIDREIGNREGVPRHLGNLGVLYRELNRFHEALQLFAESGELFRDLGERTGWMRNAINQATCYEQVGQHHRAVTLYQQAERVANECGLPFDAADCIRYRGEALLKMNDTVRGEPALNEAALRFERLNAPETAAGVWQRLAESAHSREEQDVALRCADAALQNLKSAGLIAGFDLLALHAEASLAANRFTEASRSAEAALDAVPDDADVLRIATLKAIAKKGQSSSAS